MFYSEKGKWITLYMLLSDDHFKAASKLRNEV